MKHPMPMIAFLVFVLGMFVTPGGSHAAEKPATVCLPVPLMADPHVNMHRVKAILPAERLTAAVTQTSTITIHYLGAGSGQFGDTCAIWPAEAQAAFSYAAGIWQSKLISPVPIVIDACWATNLPTGVLGHSGPLGIYSNFPNAPQLNTQYPVALANSLAGTDRAPGTSDMYIAFSSTFSWYNGTDGNTPSNKYDLSSVVLHEIGHGLGFIGSMEVSGGSGSSDVPPFIYDRFTQNGSGQSLLNFTNPSTALGTQLTSNNLYFSGNNANAANGGSPVKIYAPSPWADGSSYSHLDEIYNEIDDGANALMTFSLSLGESIHDPGPVTMSILQDLGWKLVFPPFPTLSVTISGNGNVTSGTGAIDCGTNNSGTCAPRLANGSSLTLTAMGINSTTLLSHFDRWSGECDSTSGANCTVTMNADINITAGFITNDPVHIPGGAYYTSLQAAYNGTIASSMTIEAQEVELPLADFILSGKTVVLKGGYDSAYNVNNGTYTTMKGILALQTGTLTVENLIIK